VTNWEIRLDGIIIIYNRNKAPYVHVYDKPEECANALRSISSIDEYVHDDRGLILKNDDKEYGWAAYVEKCGLCQWEALSLAILHEAEKDLYADVNLMEIDKAIEAIRKS
jgi:hypothetical protein